MDVIIFDLDNTLVDTKACRDWLNTTHGRDEIVRRIARNHVTTRLYDQRIVKLFNDLQADSKVMVAVVSDAPTDYCRAVLKSHGFDLRYVYIHGSAGKPCIDTKKLVQGVKECYEDTLKVNDVLVIGDSPKDIHFAHQIGAFSVFATWGTEFEVDTIEEQSQPTQVVSDFPELEKYIRNFREFTPEFEIPDFEDYFELVDTNRGDYKECHIKDDDIGYGHRYVTNKTLREQNAVDRQTFIDIFWVVKRAKQFTVRQLEQNAAIGYYSSYGNHKHWPSLTARAPHYFERLMQWIDDKGITGNITLVPVPSSVPSECNLTFTMKYVCELWSRWIKEYDVNYTLATAFIIDRVNPRPAAHADHAYDDSRTIEPHVKTMGIFEGADLPEDTDAIIIVDDVVTSGSQMNAVATILSNLDRIPENVPVYGFAWARTAKIDRDRGVVITPQTP